MDEALHHHLLEAMAGRHGVVVATVAHQRRRRDPGGALLARLQRHGWQIPEHFKISGKALADRLGMAARARHRAASMALRSSKFAATGIGVMKFERAYFTSPSTLPLSFPLPGRPKRSRNR